MKHIVFAVLLVGCVDGSEMPGDTDTCIVRVELDGIETDRLEADLDARRPTEVTTYRDGASTSRWTYEYGPDGRALVQHQDAVGGTPSGPDGMIDFDTIFEHAAASTTVRYTSPAGGAGEVVTYSLDAAGRVVRVVAPSYTTDFELDDNGAITRRTDDALDPEVNMRYARTERNQYDEVHRLASRTIYDSRIGPSSTMSWTYETVPNGIAVTRTGSTSLTLRWAYTFDGAGRVTRATEDADGSVWTVDIAYADDGAVTTHASRDGNDGWVYSFSSGCAYAPTVLGVPTSGARPGATWLYQLPGIPTVE